MSDDEPRQATFGSEGDLDTERDPDADTENDFGEPKAGRRNRRRLQPLYRLQPAPEGRPPLRRGSRRVGCMGTPAVGLRLEPLGPAESLCRRRPPRRRVGRTHDPAIRGAGDRALGGRRLATAPLCDPRRAGSRAGDLNTRGGQRRRVLREGRRRTCCCARSGRGTVSRFPGRRSRTRGGVRRGLRRPHRRRAKRDRGTRFFKTRGARVGPEGEDEQSARWQRLSMVLDEIDYSEREISHATEPVDGDEPWAEPEKID
jgi:hypothetical protein